MTNEPQRTSAGRLGVKGFMVLYFCPWCNLKILSYCPPWVSWFHGFRGFIDFVVSKVL